MKSLIFLFTVLISCTSSQNNSKTEETNLSSIVYLNNSNDDSINIVLKDFLPETVAGKYDLKITTFKSDSVRKDSTFLCNEFRVKEVARFNEGKCYLRLPIELDALSRAFLERLKKEKRFESFDPQICEVGGHSAYNKYKFKDLGNGKSEVIHYKAWYEDYDENGNDFTHETPEYFIGERIKIYETTTYKKFEAFDNENKLLETLEFYIDKKGNLQRQVWSSNSNEVFLIHYSYRD